MTADHSGTVRGARAFALAFAFIASTGLAATAPRNLPVEAFGSLPYHGEVELSPDGRHVAATLRMPEGKYGVVIYDLDAPGKQPVLASAGDWDVNWLRWKSDDRLLVSIRLPSIRFGTKVLETRLVAMNADGTKLQNVLEPTKEEVHAETVVQIQDDVISYLPDDPRRIMLAFNAEDVTRPRLYRMDVYTSRRELIENGKNTVQDWLIDQKGEARIAMGYHPTDMAQGYKVHYKKTPKSEWAELWSVNARGSSLQPKLFDANDPDVVYALSDHEGGTDGLYRFRLSTKEFIETLFHEPTVDIDALLYDSQMKTIQGLTYVTDIGRTKWFAPEMEAMYLELQKQLPGWALHIGSVAKDNRRVIVEATAPDHSGRYYLYEPATKKVSYFAHTYPELDKFDLARIAPVRYKARDGLEIAAYLTLPTGETRPLAKPLPTIVLPHGGPQARDYADFEPLVQMLANRGYAILQMNYRGSTGYGTEFQMAGRASWGEKMQDDVTDGTRWLIEQKIADPSRICIAGASYGGYAAMMGIVKEPKLYRCAVSLNGVSDLPDLIADGRNYVGGVARMARSIGDISDRARLARNSPARRAAEIQVPVLLVHGTDDRVVPVGQSRKMAEALDNAGKSHRYAELADEDHWLTHGATRLQAYREIDQFLGQHLKGQ